MWKQILLYSYYRIDIQHYKYPFASFKALKLRNSSDVVEKWDSIMMFAMFVTHSSILFICTLLSATHLGFHINAYDIKALKLLVCLFITLKQAGGSSALSWWIGKACAQRLARAYTQPLNPTDRAREATVLSRALQVWLWRQAWFTVHELRSGSVAGSARDELMTMLTCDTSTFFWIL